MRDGQGSRARPGRVALVAGVAVLVLLAGLWSARQRLATGLIDRRLARAGVPARYRITTLGPLAQVIEDVRLGDPAHPDLVARRIRAEWRYRFGMPALARIEIEGARLRGRWVDGRLSLGTLDRLLPRSGGGGASLPDLDVRLSDAIADIATPAGAASLGAAGSGNLANGFRGDVRLTAPRLAVAGCTIELARARVAVRIDRRAPRLTGPVAIGEAACPGRALAVGPGVAAVDVRLAPGLDRGDGRARLAGFATSAGGARVGRIDGVVTFAGAPKEVAGKVDVVARSIATARATAASARMAGSYRLDQQASRFEGQAAARGLAALPGDVASVRGASTALDGSPLGPLARRLGGTTADLMRRADAEAFVVVESGAARSMQIDRARIVSASGQEARATASLRTDDAGWSGAATIEGGALPRVEVRASGAARSAEALIRLSPYRADGAALALEPVRVKVERGAIRFATRATIDGPLGSGDILGLEVPLSGGARGGAVRIGEGCGTIHYRRVRLAGTTATPGRIDLCGAPWFARDAAGRIAVDARLRRLAIDGRSGSAPLSLRTGAVRIGAAGFAVERVAVRLGGAGEPTRLGIAVLSGAPGKGLAGRFEGAAGSIGAVPLALSGGAGTWSLAGGALRLGGALQVADRAPAARFQPLAARDVALTLVDGRIDASATLRLPAREADIATVALHHQLGNGVGGATIAVPGLVFARGGLQPEMLTPLTLGIVANVAGEVRGTGRIDWSGAAVTSSGSFTTDRLDLAAAFGPVRGIAGTIRFSDLLGLVTAPHQEALIAEINPGIPVENGVVHYRLLGDNRVGVEDARWPFAGGTLSLDPATLDFGQQAERRLTFRIAALDAAAFVQRLDFPNISATGTFDGRLPMVFDASGGRIEDGALTSRGAGTLAYVGELSNAQLGTMGKLAFDALKAIRYSTLDIALGGRLDGEIVTRVRFDGVRQATGERTLVARMIRNLPFRFNIAIRAPFRGLAGSARSYLNPALLLQPLPVPVVQPADSGGVR